MYSHIVVGTNNMITAKAFYDKVMAELGYTEGVIDPQGRCFYISKTGTFGITTPIDGAPASHANGGTIGFQAASNEAVDAWFKTGLEAGGTECEDPPGIRTNMFGKLYVAYLRDPDGNKLCALCPVKKPVNE